MPATPITRNRIIAVLRDIGPMTCNELAAELHMHPETVRSSINSKRGRGEKMFYICGYDYRPPFNGVPAIFALGNKPDVKRMDYKTKRHKSYERTRMRRALLRAGATDNPFSSLIRQVTK